MLDFNALSSKQLVRVSDYGNTILEISIDNFYLLKSAHLESIIIGNTLFLSMYLNSFSAVKMNFRQTN